MPGVIHWGNNTDIYLHIEPIDFRKSIEVFTQFQKNDYR